MEPKAPTPVTPVASEVKGFSTGRLDRSMLSKRVSWWPRRPGSRNRVPRGADCCCVTRSATAVSNDLLISSYFSVWPEKATYSSMPLMPFLSISLLLLMEVHRSVPPGQDRDLDRSGFSCSTVPPALLALRNLRSRQPWALCQRAKRTCPSIHWGLRGVAMGTWYKGG